MQPLGDKIVKCGRFGGFGWLKHVFSSVVNGALLPPIGKGQAVAVTSNAGLNAALATKSPDRGIQLTRVATHNRRSAMRKDSTVDTRSLAPTELRNDGCMANQCPAQFAHHRALDGRPDLIWPTQGSSHRRSAAPSHKVARRSTYLSA